MHAIASMPELSAETVSENAKVVYPPAGNTAQPDVCRAYPCLTLFNLLSWQHIPDRLFFSHYISDTGIKFLRCANQSYGLKNANTTDVKVQREYY